MIIQFTDDFFWVASCFRKPIGNPWKPIGNPWKPFCRLGVAHCPSCKSQPPEIPRMAYEDVEVSKTWGEPQLSSSRHGWPWRLVTRLTTMVTTGDPPWLKKPPVNIPLYSHILGYIPINSHSNPIENPDFYIIWISRIHMAIEPCPTVMTYIAMGSISRTTMDVPSIRLCRLCRCFNGWWSLLEAWHSIHPMWLKLTYPLVICYIAMENPPIFKFGKPSISMDHGFHGYVK